MNDMDYIENPSGIECAELVVGIPSFNEADKIGFPTKRVDDGLVRFFGDKSAVIINCDNCSLDNTKDVFLKVATKTPKIYLSTKSGVKGKGINLKNLFFQAHMLQAKAVIVIDADLMSIMPRWIQYLGGPLFSGFDYVIPIYVRHKYDGTITNNLAYPLTRMLYGMRVRQPIAGDFGFSGNLVKAFVNECRLDDHSVGCWNERVSKFGIDIWMTTLAINKGAKVCQTFLGRPKIHNTKDPGLHLGAMFQEVVGTLFNLMTHFEDVWKQVKSSKPTPIFGFGLGQIERPPVVKVDKEILLKKFVQGFADFENTWSTVIDSNNYNELLKIKGLLKRFNFPTTLWAKILFDFAIAYKKDLMSRTDITNSLIPLYLGKTLHFVNATCRMSVQQVEEFVEDECLIFEKEKSYLLERW